MKNLFQINNTTELSLSHNQMTATKGGKRFFGVAKSGKGWDSAEAKAFCIANNGGKVICIGSDNAMRANMYQNSKGDTICVEW